MDTTTQLEAELNAGEVISGVIVVPSMKLAEVMPSYWLPHGSTNRTLDEMRSAGETDEADVLYQRAMIKAGGARGKSKGGNAMSPSEGNLLDEDYGEGGMSVMDQIARIEDLLKKLNLVKKDRVQVLKDLKEKVCLCRLHYNSFFLLFFKKS